MTSDVKRISELEGVGVALADQIGIELSSDTEFRKSE